MGAKEWCKYLERALALDINYKRAEAILARVGTPKELVTSKQLHSKLLFYKEGSNLQAALEEHYYKVQTKEQLSFKNPDIFFKPVDNKDHLATEYIKTYNTEGLRWLKIIFSFLKSKKPNSNLLIYIQDEAFNQLERIQFNVVKDNQEEGTYINYVKIPDYLRSFRLVITTLDGSATYIPSSIKIEQSTKNNS